MLKIIRSLNILLMAVNITTVTLLYFNQPKDIINAPEFVFYIDDCADQYYKNVVSVNNPYQADFSLQEMDIEFDILKACPFTKKELVCAFSKGNYKNILPYINTFLEAEQKYGVNALYFMCQIGLESGWCTHTSGKNNVAGWARVDGSYMEFNSVDECILYVASKLSSKYKDRVGTNIADVCKRYCPNEDYVYTLLSIMSDQQYKIMEGYK